MNLLKHAQSGTEASRFPLRKAPMSNQTTDETIIKEKLKIFLNRSSVRKYLPKKIPLDVMDQLLAAAMQAPTSSHVQAFALMNVTKPELRQAFFELSGKQQWILDASHFFIVCADLHKISSWCYVSPKRLRF